MVFDPQTVREVLSAMITPAVLISASGTLVLSTTTRLGRVVDRVRVLAQDTHELGEGHTMNDVDYREKRSLITDQLTKLTRRIRLLQSAVTILYTAIGFFIGTSILVGLQMAIPNLPGWIPIALGLIGATMMLYGSTILVREARVAVGSTLNELKYVQRLVERKAGTNEFSI
jgi:hypothetical protein